MPELDIRPPVTVLIVDADADFRRSTARVLTAAGYVCRQAATGAQARRRLDDLGDVAAVVCDPRLADHSGLDFVSTLARDFGWVAVILTAGDDGPTAAIAVETGAYGYLIKP